jgi:hypothetical protein
MLRGVGVASGAQTRDVSDQDRFDVSVVCRRLIILEGRVILCEGYVFGNVWIQVDEVIQIRHSVCQRPYREVLRGEGLQAEHLSRVRDPSDGDPSQFAVRESQQERTARTRRQHLLGLLLLHETHDGPVHPGSPQVLSGELHDGVEPLPEGEVSLAERLFAELRPTQHRIARFVVITSEGLVGQESQIVFGQGSAGGGAELQRQRLCHARPWYLRQSHVDVPFLF